MNDVELLTPHLTKSFTRVQRGSVLVGGRLPPALRNVLIPSAARRPNVAADVFDMRPTCSDKSCVGATSGTQKTGLFTGDGTPFQLMCVKCDWDYGDSVLISW